MKKMLLFFHAFAFVSILGAHTVSEAKITNKNMLRENYFISPFIELVYNYEVKNKMLERAQFFNR